MTDGSLCSTELRQFLAEVPTARLHEYAAACLNEKIEAGGLILQDVINEIGRRLEFEVVPGRYRGISTAVGFDGLWRSSSSEDIVVEVKTTDAYTVDLDRLAGYRQRLIDDGRLSKAATILLVVGRQDTGALEQQVRGSRYAWDIRLVGVDALLRLLDIKTKSDEEKTLLTIQGLLRPFEYTRLDGLVDILFTTATDVEQSATDEDAPVLDNDSVDTTQKRTSSEALDEKRNQIASALAAKLETALIPRRRALFWSEDKTIRAAITLSKNFERGSYSYWYAFHPKWRAFLEEGQQGFFVLGCMDRGEAVAIPLKLMGELLPELNSSTREDGTTYWHVKMGENEKGKLELTLAGRRIPLEEYAFAIGA